MKYFNNKILEAVNRGIQLALDDFKDNEPNSSLSQKSDVIDSEDVIKQKFELQKYTVDLGLPSRILWFKCNLGATKETEYGDYYTWGETITNKAKTYDWYTYDWDTYKFGFPGAISKYNEKDNLKQLQPEDDVATQLINICGFNANIPTEEQFEELLKYTTNEWVINYKDSGINGKLFTSTINKNQIFMPAAGCIGNHGCIIDDNYYGKYWSSTHYQNYIYYHAYFLKISELSCIISDNQRANGFTIRPVINL